MTNPNPAPASPSRPVEAVPVTSKGFGEASKAILALMGDFRRRAPFGYHEPGSSHPSHKTPLILHSNDIARLLDRLLDAAIWTERAERLSSPPPREPEGMDAATVEVKPLEWVEPYANKLDASSACGVYGIALVAGRWFIRLNGSAIEPGHPYHSLSAARAAAQADYEARIRSALRSKGGE